MPRIIKENSTFISWVILPTLLLVASILGVNLVSRPVLSVPGASCNSLVTCDDTSDNSCITGETCSSPTGGTCIPTYDSTGICAQCEVCGNGVCEPYLGEDTTCDNPFQDCIPGMICGPGTLCNAVADGCCPGSVGVGAPSCQGTNPGGASYDPDCCPTCGVFPGDECGPNQPCTVPGETCNTTTCQCEPQIRCGDTAFTPSPPTTTCNGFVTAPGTICDTFTSPAANSCRDPGTADECTCCGDAVVQAGEACDPGPVPSTTCDKICRPFTSQCNKDCSAPTAADCQAIGVPAGCCGGPCALDAAGAEFCDYHQINSPNCPQPGPNCGNGIVDAGETCDHGALNGTDGDTCGFGCLPNVGRNPPTPLCGNGVVEAPEQCDSGTLAGDATCTANCTLVTDACILEGGCLGSDSGPDICANLMGTPAYQALQFARNAWWVGVFAVPGALYAGIRLRRRKK